MTPPRVLIIAGSDSGGGAGIQADIKTVTMLGGHAMTAVTSITAQNTLGVTAVQILSSDLVMAQIEAVASDIGVDAVKIGMLGSPAIIAALHQWLISKPDLPVVFDPVMVATSGAVLADAETVAAFRSLMQRASLTTPNLPELDALGGEEALIGPTLIKGGHDAGDVIVDRLVEPGVGETARWSDSRIVTQHSHGTGCTLSSAIATFLGHGMPLDQAIGAARRFVRLALRDAPGFGAGHGPMGHQMVRQDGFAPGLSLNQVTVGCSDYAASVAFYKALGLSQIVDSPGNGYARFEAPNGVTLSIHIGIAASEAGLYFEIQALDDCCADLAKSGIVFDQSPVDQSWGWREAWLRDPHGNRLCLYRAGEMRRYPPWRVN